MAIKDKVNEAWQEIETLNVPVNSAYQEADHANALVDGAWQEVWSCIKFLTELSNTFDNGLLDVRDGGLTVFYTKWEDYYDGEQDGDIGGSGDITFYLEGNWTNPTIRFDYEGGGSRSNAAMTTWYTFPAGDISIYTRTTDGTENTKEVVTNLGTSESGADIDTSNEKGSYSGVLTGTFDRIGISIHCTGYGGVSQYYSANMDMIVSNLKINNTKIAFPESSEFDYM